MGWSQIRSRHAGFVPAYGAPVVSGGAFSLSGVVGDGNVLTLSGSGLLAVAGATPPQTIYYKNNKNETNGSRIANGADFFASSLATVAPNGNGLPFCEAGSALPYGLGQIYSNDSRVGSISGGTAWGGIDITLNSLTTEIFTSIVYYFPPGCNYTPLVSAGNPQLKDFWTLSPDGNTWLYHKVCNQAISLAQAMDSNASGINNTFFGTNTAYCWNGTPYPKTGVAICVERWTQLNAAAGAGTGNILWAGVHDGTAQTVDVHHDNAILVNAGQTVGYTRINTPGFLQFSTPTNPNWTKDTNAYILAGEPYLAIASSGGRGAASRIVIGDGSTYATCTGTAKCLVKQPTDWAPGTTGITFTMQLGIFYGRSITGLSLFVINSNNVPSKVWTF